jgi:Cu+-exporting ATPase
LRRLCGCGGNGVARVPGVVSASVNFAERTAQVSGGVLAATLIQAVQQAGYDAAELRDAAAEAERGAAEQAHYQRLMRNTVVAGALAAPLMIGRNGRLAAGADQSRLAVVLDRYRVADPGGDDLQRRSFLHRRLAAISSPQRQHGHPDCAGYRRGLGLFDAGRPVSRSVPSLAQHAYFEAAVTIIALINLGSALESRARGKASAAIPRLLGLQPKTARIVENDQEQDVPIETLGGRTDPGASRRKNSGGRRNHQWSLNRG